MTGPSSTNSDTYTPETVLEAIAGPEPQTLYVLPGDLLLLPYSAAAASTAKRFQALHDHLEVRELVLLEGIDRPWILRKATLPDD
jgi:hypothetical protein